MYKFQLYKNTGRGIYIGAIDAITKAYIRKNEVFADAFNYFMYDGAQVIQPECLKELDPTEIAILLNEKDTKDKKAVQVEAHQKYRDILKSAAIMEDGHTAYILLGIENQTDVNYAMPVRNMLYDALQYTKQVSEIADVHRRKKENSNHKSVSHAEFISGFYKNDRLIPVITLVIYFNANEWDGPRSLIDMLKVPERFQSLVSDYKMNLIEVRNSEYLKFQNSDVSTVFDISRFIYDKRYDKINDMYKEQLIPSELGLVIGAITESQKLIDDAIKLEKEGGQMNMCKALEELEEKGRIEGRREGEIKGEIKNKILLIQKKSLRGDSMEKIIDDLMESIEFVQPIYEMIKQNPELSVDEIYRIISK